jgi:hypothetical protein
MNAERCARSERNGESESKKCRGHKKTLDRKGLI